MALNVTISPTKSAINRLPDVGGQCAVIHRIIRLKAYLQIYEFVPPKIASSARSSIQQKTV